MTLVQLVKDFECECGHKLSLDLSVEGNLSDFQVTIVCPRCNRVHTLNKETLFRSVSTSNDKLYKDEPLPPSSINLSNSLLDNNSKNSNDDHSADIAGFFDGL